MGRSFRQMSRNFFTAPCASQSDDGAKTLLERYEIGRELGRGRFGFVRAGVDRVTGDKVAIKTIPRNTSDTRTLKNEMALLKRVLGVPHCMQMIDWKEDAHNLHIITELYEGGELFDRILDVGYFSEKQAAQYTRQVLEAIRGCHENGVIHRDIKPENLLLTSPDPEASLVLVDFGIAEPYAVGDVLSTVCGSPTYVAPEARRPRPAQGRPLLTHTRLCRCVQVLFNKYEVKADLWSTGPSPGLNSLHSQAHLAGVILYILLCGETPFFGDTPNDILNHVKAAPH